MNYINATVTDIQSVDNITVVTFQAGEHKLAMMALGLNLPIEIGTALTLGMKASSVSLAKDFSGFISLSNQLSCVIEKITYGALLCSVKARFNGSLLESVITLNSAKQMSLEVGERITMLVKASELSILEICNDTIK